MNKTAVAVLAVVVALFSGLLVVSASRMMVTPDEDTVIQGGGEATQLIRDIPDTVGAETSVNIADNTVKTSVSIAE
ncbi:MAG: hypothetical protein ABIH67_03475 [Candidatus Uhrbacteria bacterium]